MSRTPHGPWRLQGPPTTAPHPSTSARVRRLQSRRSQLTLGTIEISNSRLGPVMFNPIKEKLRARYRKSALIRDEHTDQTSMLPDEIPGIYITVNLREKWARLVDPLSLPDYKTMLDQITSAKRSQNVSAGACGFHTYPTYENLSNSELKTWLYEIRKLLDHPYHQSKEWRDNPARKMGGPMAIIIQGTLPVRQEIERMPGEIACNFFSNSHTAKRARAVVEEAAQQS